MLLGFKTELKLNNQQRTELLKHAGTARHAWNWGLKLTRQILDHNQANLENTIKFPSGIDLHKWLVALVKPENPWYFEVSKCAPQYALRDLRMAWDRCFKKVSVGDMGFYEFRRQLEYKTKLYGAELVTVDRWFPSSKTCSNCGTKKETLSLSERVFECEDCRFSLDRDLNAAINLKNVVSHPMSACGSGEADFSELKQEDFSLLANVSKLSLTPD